jgi:hypothetical protein
MGSEKELIRKVEIGVYTKPSEITKASPGREGGRRRLAFRLLSGRCAAGFLEAGRNTWVEGGSFLVGVWK